MAVFVAVGVAEDRFTTDQTPTVAREKVALKLTTMVAVVPVGTGVVVIAAIPRVAPVVCARVVLLIPPTVDDERVLDEPAVPVTHTTTIRDGSAGPIAKPVKVTVLDDNPVCAEEVWNERARDGAPVVDWRTIKPAAPFPPAAPRLPFPDPPPPPPPKEPPAPPGPRPGAAVFAS